MEKAKKSNIFSIIKDIKRIIKLNKHKSPSLGLDNSLNELTKLLNKGACDSRFAYLDILLQFNEFIDSCNIHTTQTNESILDQIKEHYELYNASNSEEDSDSEAESDNIADNYELKQDNNNNEENNKENSTSNNEENSTSNNEKYNTSNKINDSLYHKIMNNLNNALEKAIISNNEELINDTIKLMNTLATSQVNNINLNKINNIEQTPNTNEIAFVKTPEWLERLNCSINSTNKKKRDNKSFEYAIALSMTAGDNRNRPTNIAPNFKHFNFNDINHPPTQEDYKTFEINNQSIQLTIFKIGNIEKLHFHYSIEDNKGRNKKVVIILLKNNHYIYLTKPKSLTKYIISN